MPISKHDIYWNPKKSPYNFEKYDSKLECWMMEKLDADPTVVKWMKRHGISIPWVSLGLELITFGSRVSSLTHFGYLPLTHICFY